MRLDKFPALPRDRKSISGTVLEIEEPDFGCEGRPEQKPVFCRILLLLENGRKETVYMEEKKLFQSGMDDGMEIILTRDGEINILEK